jgi:hypothetical protein
VQPLRGLHFYFCVRGNGAAHLQHSAFVNFRAANPAYYGSAAAGRLAIPCGGTTEAALRFAIFEAWGPRMMPSGDSSYLQFSFSWLVYQEEAMSAF